VSERDDLDELREAVFAASFSAALDGTATIAQEVEVIRQSFRQVVKTGTKWPAPFEALIWLAHLVELGADDRLLGGAARVLLDELRDRVYWTAGESAEGEPPETAFGP
jgi:hypothetical protein